jgi:hypothetical protein
MPCSKNNKNNKNNKNQKYNCLTNSVSHCRNLNPPTPPTPPTPPPIYLTSETYDVRCDQSIIDPLKTSSLYNTLVKNIPIGETDKLLSLLFQNADKSYSSNYIFEFKHNFTLKFIINIFQEFGYGRYTLINGVFVVGNTANIPALFQLQKICAVGCKFGPYNIAGKYEGVSLIDNTFNKSFAIYEIYQFSSGPSLTENGYISQVGDSDESNTEVLGHVEVEVGLPIKLPLKVPEELLKFNGIFETINYPISLTPRFYQNETIDNFLYKIDANKIIITEEYIKENCLAKVTGILNFKYAQSVKTTTTVEIFAEIQRGVLTTIKERIYKKTFTDVYYYNDDLFDNAKINTELELGDKISFTIAITLTKSSQTPISGYVRDNLSFTVYKEL